MMNKIYIFCITINTFLFITNLCVLEDISSALFNVACGGLCWIGYYNTKEIKNGDK